MEAQKITGGARHRERLRNTSQRPLTTDQERSNDTLLLQKKTCEDLLKNPLHSRWDQNTLQGRINQINQELERRKSLEVQVEVVVAQEQTEPKPRKKSVAKRI